MLTAINLVNNIGFVLILLAETNVVIGICQQSEEEQTIRSVSSAKLLNKFGIIIIDSISID